MSPITIYAALVTAVYTALIASPVVVVYSVRVLLHRGR